MAFSRELTTSLTAAAERRSNASRPSSTKKIIEYSTEPQLGHYSATRALGPLCLVASLARACTPAGAALAKAGASVGITTSRWLAGHRRDCPGTRWSTKGRIVGPQDFRRSQVTEARRGGRSRRASRGGIYASRLLLRRLVFVAATSESSRRVVRERRATPPRFV